MRWAIGFWLISFGIAIFVTDAFDTHLNFKEKAKLVLIEMVVLTLLIAGTYVMVGGM